MYWQMAGVIEAVAIEIEPGPSDDSGAPKKVQTVFDLRESLGEKTSSMSARKCRAFASRPTFILKVLFSCGAD